MEKLDILQTLKLFNPLSEKEKRMVANLDFRLFRFSYGTTIIQKGDFKTDLFFLVKGTVTVLDNDTHPRAVLKTGDLFGEVGFLDPTHPRTANVVANKEVVVMRLERELFQTLEAPLKEHLKDRLIGILVENMLNNQMENNMSLSPIFD